MSTTTPAGTRIDEIAPSIFRLSTPVPPSAMPGGFTFNQFLIVDEEPLLFHTGMRSLFPAVKEAVAHVLGDVARLRWVSFSHVEADECGALNDWLAVAPLATAVHGELGVMLSVGDLASRPPRALADGGELVMGTRRVKWIAAPHLPHNWETGYLFETTTRTLLCGDVFTHGGDQVPPLTTQEVVSPAEAMRAAMPGSVALERGTRAMLHKLAATEPATLAIMHGSSYSGDGARLLRDLADAMGV